MGPIDGTPVAEGPILSRLELLDSGYTAKKITKAVREGTLVRLRRDHYAVAGADVSVARAVRIGGRLTCVSAIASVSDDVFVFEASHLHVHAERDRSRLRAPDDRTKRWRKEDAARVRVSWGALADTPPSRHVVSLVDAVRALVRCLPQREAIATLDSLLHLGLVTMPQVREAVADLPTRYRQIVTHLDPRSESGSESFMRLILHEIGARFELQVRIDGVGRVDFLVDGFLIVECDSRAFHEGWSKQREDRKRDMAAAAQGYFTLRVLAEDVMYRPAQVAEAIRELLAARHTWAGC